MNTLKHLILFDKIKLPFFFILALKNGLRRAETHVGHGCARIPHRDICCANGYMSLLRSRPQIFQKALKGLNASAKLLRIYFLRSVCFC